MYVIIITASFLRDVFDFKPYEITNECERVVLPVWLCQGQQQAELFVQDFIITQLIGKDVLELCAINNPMGLLVDVLQQLAEPEPEPR